MGGVSAVVPESVCELREVFNIAQKRGIFTSISRLDELDSDDYELKGYLKPNGYAAQTLFYFGGKAVVAMLDSCATVSAIPEEIAAMILEHAFHLLDSGAMALEDERYPITRIEKYQNPGSLTGVAT